MTLGEVVRYMGEENVVMHGVDSKIFIGKISSLALDNDLFCAKVFCEGNEQTIPIGELTVIGIKEIGG